MPKALPPFRRVKRSFASAFIHRALSSPRGPALRKLIAYDDNHFRAVFAITYFELAEGNREPSKSQWSTLKKKLKRRDRRVFVFKRHGQTKCGKRAGQRETCLYLDFGFLPD